MLITLTTSWSFSCHEIVVSVAAPSFFFLWASPAQPSRDRPLSPSRIVPKKFIIEVDTTANIPQKRSFARYLDAVYAGLHARDVEFEITREFEEPGVFVGATVTIGTSEVCIQMWPLSRIFLESRLSNPVKIYDRPEPAHQHVATGVSDPDVPSIGESVHRLTGVDKLHAQGIKGKGIKVAIIDTGVDYLHPFLGGGIGPRKKVIGGYDFVGDDYDGYNDPIPDDDPIDTCVGHGTHVTGIVGLDSPNEYNVTSVANPKLLFSPTESSVAKEELLTIVIIIAAFVKAANDGADVINLSLGRSDGWSSSATAVVASRIADSGKAAAGNESLVLGSPISQQMEPALSQWGSLENTIIPLQSATLSGVDRERIVYNSFRPLPIEGEWPIYVTSNSTDNPADACDPPSRMTTPDLSKYVTLVRRGTCFFEEKMTNVGAKGGKNALFYNNEGMFIPVEVDGYVTAHIPREDGEYLVNQWVNGADIKMRFPQAGGLVPTPNGLGRGLMSDFSSYGPTYDFLFKPAVCGARGTHSIFLPSSPAAALIPQHKGLATAKAVRDLLETNAQTIPSTHEEGSLPQTVAQAGSGLINVHASMFATTVVSPGELSSMTLRRLGNVIIACPSATQAILRESTSSLTPRQEGTALTIKENSILPEWGPVPLSNAAARVVINPSQLTLAPGQTRQVVVTVLTPSGYRRDPLTLSRRIYQLGSWL
ncbi:peptidase S8/S53 domain-containing protein [Coprinopsis sp. MPI-PUGE-AT-0042]|nr:peptidase S8/S53 domain-containing protein [Coprinopsis sp. MPI-PUGE-AT-0042]